VPLWYLILMHWTVSQRAGAFMLSNPIALDSLLKGGHLYAI